MRFLATRHPVADPPRTPIGFLRLIEGLAFPGGPWAVLAPPGPGIGTPHALLGRQPPLFLHEVIFPVAAPQPSLGDLGWEPPSMPNILYPYSSDHSRSDLVRIQSTSAPGGCSREPTQGAGKQALQI